MKTEVRKGIAGIVRSVWIVIFLSSALCLHSQHITVRDIPLLDQLPVSAIHRIFQDREGYMWYGTVNGLCRDDGYNIHTFRSDLYHPEVLSNNSITCIAEDSQGKIWFGTRKGAYILDKSTYKISLIDIAGLPGKDIYSISATSEGSVWIHVSGDLLRLTEQGALVKKYTIPFGDGSGKSGFLYEDRNHTILLSVSGDGLYKLNKESYTFEPFLLQKGLSISTIIQDKDKEYYWIGIRGKGIARLDPPNRSKKAAYLHELLPVNVMGQQDGQVFHIVQDEVYGYIWGTFRTDLFVFRITPEGAPEQICTSHFIPPCNKMLYEILKSRDGNLWVSAFDRKSFILSFSAHEMHEYPIPSLEKRIKSNPAIVTLCKDEKGIFWFSQERIGLCLYQPETDKVTHYSDCPEVKGLPLGTIPYLTKSRQPGKVWVISYGTKVLGLTRKDMEIRVSQEIELKDAAKDAEVIECIFEDKDANLWIGTLSGIYLYRAKTGTLEIISETLGNVSGITQTKGGMIWATIRNKGICSISPEKKLTVYPSKKDFLCIDAGKENELWLGTGEGEVWMFSPGVKNNFTDYSLACGMNGDMVDNIAIDKYNHVWIITNQQIKEFNPKNGAYRSFSASNPAILLNRFLPRAVYEDKDGVLYFGGIPGIISMNPSQRLESTPQQVKASITNIKIMGQSILFDHASGDNISPQIEIHPEEQNLEIEFSSLDYQHTDQIRYAYRLKGVDHDWVYLPPGKNSAFYNKLDKGKYTFEVKATDKNGLWSNEITEITINRLPTFYETWWAYTLYFVIAIALLGTILYLYLQRIKQENSKRFTEEITQTKLRYFTNISHELLTPLSILSCITEDMESSDAVNKREMKLMQSNITRLKRLLQQVLDFRKIENRKMELFVAEGDLLSFVKSICEHSFAPLAQTKDITLSFNSSLDRIVGYYDEDKLDKILFNILSNAFKYTPPGKEVRVEMDTYNSETHTYLRLRIKDQGVGIAPKELNKIFTRFYSNKSNEAGLSNGIGLSLTKELTELHHGKIHVESRLGTGTEFSIEFPIDKASYAPHELKADSSRNQVYIPSQEESATQERADENKERKTDYTLLLVEDNDELLSLMESIFSKSYQVHTARNGKEALKVIKKQAIDIVVSDIMMPEIDGLELCQILKNDLSTSHIIVILLTAKTAVEDRIGSYEVGADDYMPKPFEIKVLKARLENLLFQRKKRQSEFKDNPQAAFISNLGFTSLDEQLIEKALKIVEENLANPDLDVAILADKLNVSRSTFSRKIKAITGQTSLNFIRNIKMQHARRMLSNTTVTVSEVIIALGYNDHKHFTNSFKEAFGMTPSEYQKQNKPPRSTTL